MLNSNNLDADGTNLSQERIELLNSCVDSIPYLKSKKIDISGLQKKIGKNKGDLINLNHLLKREDIETKAIEYNFTVFENKEDLINKIKSRINDITVEQNNNNKSLEDYSKLYDCRRLKMDLKLLINSQTDQIIIDSIVFDENESKCTLILLLAFYHVEILLKEFPHEIPVITILFGPERKNLQDFMKDNNINSEKYPLLIPDRINWNPTKRINDIISSLVDVINEITEKK